METLSDTSAAVMTGDRPATQPALDRPPKQRLLEELPVFCERCGYSLNGLPQVRCGDCGLLQFHCPECGHHQPINTLRPAVQRILSRCRAWVVGLVLLAKINYFGWLLFAWVVGGHEMSYTWMFRPGRTVNTANLAPYAVRLDDLIGMGLLGLFFGMVGRMLLLRWRNGGIVGLVLGGLVALALVLGAQWRYVDISTSVQPPWTFGFLSLVTVTALAVALGAGIVWWIWVACALLFLPRKTAQGLLDWQRSLSTPRATGLARE